MGQLSDLQQARRRLGLALDPLCHDRWLLCYLHGTSLQPIAASEVSRRLLKLRPLMPLARRALHERRPMVVNSVIEDPSPTNGYDWELDWPAILYAPIAELGRKPVGLLILGCRQDHWYTEEDVAYAHSVALTLTTLVTALRGPLGRLDEGEIEVAQLLSYGFSPFEIAQAIHVDERRARASVDNVTRKLLSVSAGELTFPLIPVKRRAYRL